MSPCDDSLLHTGEKGLQIHQCNGSSQSITSSTKIKGADEQEQLKGWSTIRVEWRDDVQTKWQRDSTQLRLKVEPKLDAQTVGCEVSSWYL